MYRDPYQPDFKPTYDDEIAARVVIRKRGFEVIAPFFTKVFTWSATLNAVLVIGGGIAWAGQSLPPPPPAPVECPPAIECPAPAPEPEVEPEVGPSIEAALLRGPSFLDCPPAPERLACAAFRSRCWRVCNGLGDYYAAGIWDASGIDESCVCSGQNGVLTFTRDFSHVERVFSLDSSE